METRDVIRMFSDYYKEIRDGQVVEGKMGLCNDPELTSVQVGMALAVTVNEILKTIYLELKA